MTATPIYSTALLLWLSPLLLAVGGRGCGSDEDRLQGRWMVVEAISDGKDQGSVGAFFTFDRGKLIGEYDEESKEGWYRLVAGSEPKAIDIGSEDETYAAIYRLDDDELTICYNEKDEMTRPTAFSSEKGSPMLLIRLKRIE